MRKLIILCLLILIPFTVEAIILSPQVVKYRGTAALRISAVNGTAFVDNLPAEVLALPLDGTHQIEIYPATTPSGRMIRGVLKAVGVAETSSEEIVNGDNEAALVTTNATVRQTLSQSDVQAPAATYSAKSVADATTNTHYI